jgi:hypothetical protein
MTLREEFEFELKSKYEGVKLLFETNSTKYIEWLEQKVEQGQILHIDSVIKRYSDCCNALIDTDEQSEEICTNCEERI